METRWQEMSCIPRLQDGFELNILLCLYTSICSKICLNIGLDRIPSVIRADDRYDCPVCVAKCPPARPPCHAHFPKMPPIAKYYTFLLNRQYSPHCLRHLLGTHSPSGTQNSLPSTPVAA